MCSINDTNPTPMFHRNCESVAMLLDRLVRPKVGRQSIFTFVNNSFSQMLGIRDVRF